MIRKTWNQFFYSKISILPEHMLRVLAALLSTLLSICLLFEKSRSLAIGLRIQLSFAFSFQNQSKQDYLLY